MLWQSSSISLLTYTPRLAKNQTTQKISEQCFISIKKMKICHLFEMILHGQHKKWFSLHSRSILWFTWKRICPRKCQILEYSYWLFQSRRHLRLKIIFIDDISKLIQKILVSQKVISFIQVYITSIYLPWIICLNLEN